MRPGEWREPAPCRHACEPLEAVTQFELFGGKLCRRRQMLQGAAAAYPKVRARRRHARLRLLDDLQQQPLIVLTMACAAPKADDFPRQRAGDKGGLAAADNAIALVRECNDRAGLDLAGLQCGPQSCASQARRNSRQCGSGESRSMVFTRSSSS